MSKKTICSIILLFLLVIGIGPSFLLPDQAAASCMAPPIGGRWINPNTSNVTVKSIGLSGSCYDVMQNGRFVGSDDSASIEFSNGSTGMITSKTSWASVDVEKSTASIRLNYSNATVRQTHKLLSSGWLEVKTRVDYLKSNDRDFVKTEYLLRAKYDNKYSVAECGPGCIAGADVSRVSFVLYESNGNVSSSSDIGNLFCYDQGNASCELPSSRWSEIEARIVIRDGSILTHKWKNNRHVSQVESTWPYPIDSFANNSSKQSKASEKANSKQDSEIKPSSKQVQVKVISSTGAIKNEGLGAANCKLPKINSFYATTPPQDAHESVTFRLYYEVEGADKIELFGNKLKHGKGYYDVTGDRYGWWSVWAKVDGTPDNCYSEYSIQVSKP